MAPTQIEPSILAIIVLYKMTLEESDSVRTLLNILNSDPDLARHFSLILYDNSPEPQRAALALEVPVHYTHDATNAGLAAAYNYALAYAAETKHEWLLLLDQDTLLTHEFLAELVARAAEMGANQYVASIVPKLLVSGRIYSPELHFIDALRHPFERNHAVSKDLSGVHPGRLAAYNSGATLKVSALRSIGGFPEEYWLDFLDHAVFHALSVHGFCMCIMNAMLVHDASQSQSSSPIWRKRNILFAQTRFVRQAGNFFDRLLFRLYLLRLSKGLLLFHSDKRLWKEVVSQALLLRKGCKDREHNEIPTRPSR